MEEMKKIIFLFIRNRFREEKKLMKWKKEF